MRQTITVDSSAVIESVTAEIYTSYADLKAQFERSIDESVNQGKTELVSETSQLVGKLDEMVSKIVEDKVSSFLRSEVVMEAVIEAVKARLAPDMVMNNKPWWKWW
jgi:hypothetical protein